MFIIQKINGDFATIKFNDLVLEIEASELPEGAAEGDILNLAIAFESEEINDGPEEETAEETEEIDEEKDEEVDEVNDEEVAEVEAAEVKDEVEEFEKVEL